MSARPLPADNPASDEEGDHEGSADILSDEEQSAEKEITKTKTTQRNVKIYGLWPTEPVTLTSSQRC